MWGTQSYSQNWEEKRNERKKEKAEKTCNKNGMEGMERGRKADCPEGLWANLD